MTRAIYSLDRTILVYFHCSHLVYNDLVTDIGLNNKNGKSCSNPQKLGPGYKAAVCAVTFLPSCTRGQAERLGTPLTGPPDLFGPDICV